MEETPALADTLGVSAESGTERQDIARTVVTTAEAGQITGHKIAVNPPAETRSRCAGRCEERSTLQ